MATGVTAVDRLRVLAVLLRRHADPCLWPVADFVERALVDPAAPVAVALDLPADGGAAAMAAAVAASTTDRFSIADVLDDLAAEARDNRIRHAARILRGVNGGRPAIDDDEALEEVRQLVAAGAAPSIALRNAARRMPLDGARLDSVVSRLRRKWRAEKNLG